MVPIHLLIMLIHILIVLTHLLMVLLHLLIMLIHLTTVSILLLIVPTNPLIMPTHLMTTRIHLLIQPMPLIHQLQISVSQIPFVYSYHSMIILSFEVLKSIIFYLIIFHLFFSFITPYLWLLFYIVFIFNIRIKIILLKSIYILILVH